MNTIQTLKHAIISLELSSIKMRRDATAIAIFLLERILSAESKVPGNMERYWSKLEYGYDEISEYEENIRPLSYAKSMLYGTYGLRHFQRLGISHYIRNID